MGTERYETIVVGGGQAGLAAGYHLAKLNRPFVIFDGGDRVGDAWRNRWDSLRLFTPSRFNSLPGMRFPGSRNTFPTKDEMADYLESYADRFELPVKTGHRVSSVTRDGDGFDVRVGRRHYRADNVIVASGAHHVPRIPSCAAELDPDIVQLHSSEYRSPEQLNEGGVLVVGAGNSGAEIALELAEDHETWLSGAPSGQIPFKHGRVAGRTAFPVIRFLGSHLLTIRTPIGRKVRPKFLALATPLIRTKLKHLAAAGVEHVGRTIGAPSGKPVVEGDRMLDVANVIWCTGFRTRFDWVDLPVFGDDGMPDHHRGIVEREPGLYFVGLKFQYAVASDVIPGVGRDAAFITRHITARMSGIGASKLRAVKGREAA